MPGYITLTQKTEDASELTLQVIQSPVSPTLDEMQKVVGGLIEPMFTIPSPEGGSRCLTGYVNEEGLLLSLPMFGFVGPSHRECFPFAGNMLVVGLDDKTGDTVPLTDAELEMVRRAWDGRSQMLRLDIA